jgi:hypothetical protein
MSLVLSGNNHKGDAFVVIIIGLFAGRDAGQNLFGFGQLSLTN